ncbi:MAG: TetR/AcrR family transcriptional regulator [Gracilibacteraceae bacterium]|jgi:TetR/AcrR family fatty acid metabolism transcriptional regulator|nr:TetR/AcrR family transcriptional regulator [Gracilibacteraceae bacterium]
MNKADKKLMIFDAARELFYNRGFAETTMQEIADKAGMGKGTLYGYFTGKEELFRELLRYDEMQHYSRLTEILCQDCDLRAKMYRLAEFNVEVLEREYRLLEDMMQYDIFPESWKTMAVDYKMDMMENTVRQAMASGEINSNLSVETATSVLFGSFSLYCFSKVILERKHPGRPEFEILYDMIFRGLAP